MSSTVTYKFPLFRMTWNGGDGRVDTHYPDGTFSTSIVAPNTHDDYHGMLLGMRPEEHRLHHELAHHLLARALDRGCPFGGCPIIYADAHGLPQAEDAKDLEWMVTALQYASRGLMRAMDHSLGDAVRRADGNPFFLADTLRHLFDHRRSHAEIMV